MTCRHMCGQVAYYRGRPALTLYDMCPNLTVLQNICWAAGHPAAREIRRTALPSGRDSPVMPYVALIYAAAGLPVDWLLFLCWHANNLNFANNGPPKLTNNLGTCWCVCKQAGQLLGLCSWAGRRTCCCQAGLRLPLAAKWTCTNMAELLPSSDRHSVRGTAPAANVFRTLNIGVLIIGLFSADMSLGRTLLADDHRTCRRSNMFRQANRLDRTFLAQL